MVCVNGMSDFPVSGVIGVVANNADELDAAVRHGLSCVEIRADLLFKNGMVESQFLDLVRETRQRELGCLVTLRHPSHGGCYEGTERERLSINLAAINAGADLVDLEWDSEAFQLALVESGLPLVASYHNFNAMPSPSRLDELTDRMLELNPVAIKVVPTASTTSDAFRMLQWVSMAQGGVVRIGFAMGDKGAPSRILTTACGGSVTYAAFGDVVAPGQVGLDDLLTHYRVESLNRDSVVYAVTPSGEHAGDDDSGHRRRVSEKQAELNLLWSSRSDNQVAIGFPEDSLESMTEFSGNPLALQVVEV